MVDQRQYAEADKALDEIRTALIGFAMVNGRLPRPATSATDGSERVAVCASEAQCTGFIPWAALGVPKLDSWGKIYRYSVTPAFTVLPLSIGPTPPATVGTKVIRERNPAAPFALTTVIPVAGQATVPAVIYTSGRNNWGTSDAGVAFPDSSATNVDEDTNNAATTTFIRRTRSTNTAFVGGEYDDVLIYISNQTIFGAMIKSEIFP